jgi:class 3 adenylate cyclase
VLRVKMDDGTEFDCKPGDVSLLPSGHDAWVVGDEPVHIIDFAGHSDAIGMPREHERIVATLLMTDIVDSTRTASRLGDAAWKDVPTDHNGLIRAQLLRFGGSEINTTGDGFLATFRSAVSALRCAAAIPEAIRDTGVEVRCGVHTGEVEIMGNDIGGVAVHATARIMALAGASETIASARAVGLAEGSGLPFEPAGEHDVKGLDRPIEVYRLMGGHADR